MHQIPLHIRYSNLLGSLADDEVEQILAASKVRRLGRGDVVCRQGEPGNSMFVIVRGRVSISVDHGGGSRRLLNHLGPGDHFGEMSLLVGGKRSATATSTADSEVLELKRGDFERLITKVPGFAANLSRSLGEWLRGQITGDRPPERWLVAMVRATPAAHGLAAQIADTVDSQGGRLHVLSDQPAKGKGGTWHELPRSEKLQSYLQRQITLASERRERVLVDIDASQVTPGTLMQHELVWWVVDCDEASVAEALADIRKLLISAPQLVSRIQLVLTFPESDHLPAAIDTSRQLSHRPMRVGYTRAQGGAQFLPRDLSRLVNQMRGLQLGIALGGGGARGIAHIGVLDACERAGIHFDRVAGTSAGAIVAAAYAAGIPLSRVLEVFTHEMTPPPLLRWIPKAPQWYMLAVFRFGLAEAKFRRYLFDYTFEQLCLPAQLVTVDLISGEHRVRQSGDVVSSVLESINHPVFGRPILRNGEALVDGGVLMNLPVTALRDACTDFSVAVDVSKQLSPVFAGNTKATPTSKMRRPGYISTLLRVTDVELKSLANLHGSQSDFLIAPNTADFPFDDFSKGPQLVEAGRRAAEESMPQLKAALADAWAWDRQRTEVEPVRVSRVA